MTSLEHDLNNSSGPLILFESTGSNDHFMEMLPRRLRDFILYEALADGNVESVYRHWKSFDFNVDETLAFLVRVKMQWTSKDYGEKHPDLVNFAIDKTK